MDQYSFIPISMTNPASWTVFNLTHHAELGEASAQYLLGETYLNGSAKEAIRPDVYQALFWLEKAAEQKHPSALTTLGRVFEKSDPPKSLKYYQAGAEVNDSNAMLGLSRLYLRGAKGIPQNTKDGLQSAVNSAMAGNVNGMVLVASLLYEGAGIPQDKVEAIVWLKRALLLESNSILLNDLKTKIDQWSNTLTIEEQTKLTTRLLSEVTPAVPAK